MISESTIYWITRLDGLKEAVTGVGIACIVISCILLFVFLMFKFPESESDEKKWATKYIFMSLLFLFLSAGIAALRAFIPTTREMCAIKAIPMIVNNEEVQELPAEIIDLVNEWVEELKPNKGD